MTDTVKLIVEIPTLTRDYLNYNCAGPLDKEKILHAVKYGIPLDTVREEIADIPTYRLEVHEVRARVLQILDNIGKESEE